MYRTHNCGELRISNTDEKVTLAGWMAVKRDLGGLTFIDLRDRYGITQLTFDKDQSPELAKIAERITRETVLQVKGIVKERSSKNPNRPTGDIEIDVDELVILNGSKLPPFLIEDETDGGEELRMRYRYLDIRRNPVKEKLIFRSMVALETRKYLGDQNFVEVETPVLIKTTPEGARDFVVPSRMHPGQFYALPQSPQTFKQILMVAGMDRYFQLVKCFRDEDLRADRQPEFTQIDCEMSFVHRDDVLETFEGLTKHIFKECIDVELPEFPRMSYDEAMKTYGSDKPDLRFDMPFVELNHLVKDQGFVVFDSAELVVGICAKGIADQYSNKDMKKLTEWVQRPQIGAKGLVYAKFQGDGSIKSTVGKFFDDDAIKQWGEACEAETGDILLILAGEKEKTRKQLGELRLEMGRRLNLIKPGDYKPLWVVDFPLLEWDEETERFHAMHHPFTSPKAEDQDKMLSGDHETMKALRADAYDLVINGVEIGGGSIRIHDRQLQSRNLDLLGFSKEEAEKQFGFLLGAFEYGAPPHGGIAFGFDRLCAIMQGEISIRDYIAFPKNNQGRDTMIDAPSTISEDQLEELNLKVTLESPDKSS
ncbi:MAG: aspartate--tRNA ligase [Saprospiraceae bacterium]|nr:aspartate--tRNA ligase [Saprospiraceae bacterium]